MKARTIDLMGEAKRRMNDIGVCVYCSSTKELSDEHVIPFGLGGKLVLKKSSCSDCAKETSAVEQRLLRGHWWPQRVRAALQSRTKHQQITPLDVTILHGDGSESPAQLSRIDQTVFFEFGFTPPTILNGRQTSGEPFSEFPTMRFLGAQPNSYLMDDKTVALKSNEQIRIPIDYSSIDLFRFLAKVGHCYAISKRGMSCCREWFLPKIILGNTDGAKTYVGGASSEVLGVRLPGNELHAVMDRRNGKFLTVYIQLFRSIGDPPPIYEVVVGSLD